MNPPNGTSWRTIGSITLVMALLIALTGIGAQIDSATPRPTAPQRAAKASAAKTRAAQRQAVRAELQRQARPGPAALSGFAGRPQRRGIQISRPLRQAAAPADLFSTLLNPLTPLAGLLPGQPRSAPPAAPVPAVDGRFIRTNVLIERQDFTDLSGHPTGSRQIIRLPNGGRLRLAHARVRLAGNGSSQPPRLLAANAVTSCNGPATVDILATEITYGAAGQDVPLHLDFQVNANPAVQLFGASDLQGLEGTPSAQNPVQIADFGGTIAFTAHAAFPNFTTPTFAMDVPNTDLNNALLLINGDNFFTLAAAKGVQQTPLGGQLPIAGILSQYLDGPGNVINLQPNQILALYELGTRNPASPAFDFQDLILKITMPCAVANDMVIYDRIGEGGTLLNNSFSDDISAGGRWGSFKLLGSVFTPQNTGDLTTYTVNIGATNDTGTANGGAWSEGNYEVHFFNCVDQAQSPQSPPCTQTDSFLQIPFGPNTDGPVVGSRIHRFNLPSNDEALIPNLVVTLQPFAIELPKNCVFRPFCRLCDSRGTRPRPSAVGTPKC